MLFNSIAFALFLPAVLAGYYVTRGRSRLWLLLAASYLFYGWWDWRFCGLLLLTTLADFGIGRRLENATDARRRLLFLSCSAILNLGVLCTFKYFDFFSDSALRVAASLGLDLPAATARIVMPMGLSFYTFKSLSYTLDVYRGMRSEPSLLRYATFVAFFPQISAGPIVKSTELLPQLAEDRSFSLNEVLTGASLILWGLFKKVCIADSLANVVDPRFSEPSVHSSLSLAIGVYFYAFQIYCDFSGYSDMAIGIGRMLGFQTSKNFDLPYFSSTLAEFWNRWHISLSQWLRDYIFKPLQFELRSLGLGASIAATLATFLASGVWHGSHWTFVAWGGLHGAALSMGLLLRPFDRRIKRMPAWAGKLRRALGVFATFNFVCFAWILFRSRDFATFADVVSRLSAADGSFGEVPSRFLVVKGLLLVGGLLAIELLGRRYSLHDLALRFPVLRLAAAAVLVWVIALMGTFTGQRFIYSQF